MDKEPPKFKKGDKVYFFDNGQIELYGTVIDPTVQYFSGADRIKVMWESGPCIDELPNSKAYSIPVVSHVHLVTKLHKVLK
jgi:hypothetical protein